MSCHFINYAGEDIALLLAVHNWTHDLKVTPSLPAEVQRAISNRESRRNYARSFRYALEYAIDTFDAKETTDLKLWLLRLKGETVAVPMWPDYVEITGSFNAGATSLPIAYGPPVRYGAEWIILSNDTNTYEIVTVDAIDDSTVTLHSATTLNWPSGTLMFPLLFGRLSESPKWDNETDEMVSGAIKVEDDSPFARRLAAYPGAVPTVGANIAEFSTMPLWTFRPERTKLLSYSETTVLAKQFGYLRQKQKQVYSQANPRGLEMEFTCTTRADVAWVERFFTNRRGTTKPFLLPDFNGVVRLTGDLPTSGNASLIPIEASRFTDSDYLDSVPGAPYLALIDRNVPDAQWPLIEPIRLASIDGAGLHTTVPVGLAHAKTDTIVTNLLLVRFAESKLQWSYTKDGFATVRIKFIELPDEYATPNPDLPEPCYLYRFVEATNPPRERGYFTNYEQAVVWNEITWTPAPLEHSIIEETLTLEDKTDLTCWGDFPNNPLALFLPLDLEADLWVYIVEVDFADLLSPENDEILFTGKIVKPRMKGNDWKAGSSAFGGFFDGKFPRFLLQRSDNFVQFTPPTQLGAVGFLYRPVINSIDAAGTTLVCGPWKPLDPTAVEEPNFFAFGFMNTGDVEAGTYKGRAILHSEADTLAGTVTLVIDRPLPADYVGARINLYPGYDGSIEQCDDKFANEPNHGGHAFITDTGPQIKAAEAQQSGGGKKG